LEEADKRLNLQLAQCSGTEQITSSTWNV